MRLRHFQTVTYRKASLVKVELISSLVWHSFSCSGLDKNVKSFSSAVVPLADSLKRSSDVAVKRAIACALERLSRDPYNCFIIHQHDALKVKQSCILQGLSLQPIVWHLHVSNTLINVAV